MRQQSSKGTPRGPYKEVGARNPEGGNASRSFALLLGQRSQCCRVRLLHKALQALPTVTAPTSPAVLTLRYPNTWRFQSYRSHVPYAPSTSSGIYPQYNLKGTLCC